MRQQEQDTKLPNNILSETKITGNIETNGDFRIDGIIEGNVNSKGKVVIGANGLIKGEVNCAFAEISGTLEGKIIVSELLSLKSTSKITGDIKIGKLSIEPGAYFSGTCTMENKNAGRPAVQEKK
jgi:cytoskeletal protein CcmA (bactofilin family)